MKFVEACHAAQASYEEWIQCFSEPELNQYFSQLAAIRQGLVELASNAAEIVDRSEIDD